MKEPYSIIFFGSPEFAIPSLEAITRLEDCKILAVVTETDKPAGRGHKLKSPPIKSWADAHNLPVLQPNSLKGTPPKSKNSPADTLPDIGITVAYGKILSTLFIETPRLGIINVHASLLPRWRGAAPLQRAILAGDAETGVCLMQTERELDTGAVFHRKNCTIDTHETLGSLHDKLAVLGAEALNSALPDILAGKCKASAQLEDGVSYADKWTTEDSQLRWADSYAEIERRVRACSPTPGTRTNHQESGLVKIYAVEQAPNYSYPAKPPGTIVDVQRKKIIISCGNNEFLVPTEIQLAGRKRMPIASAMQGFKFEIGESFQ
ncbi:UNVERIFIED_CONTAM: hypothetical protein GTU68_012986 [Idotea baltica]|nr:hypothetical protein [Idotea baltica]